MAVPIMPSTGTIPTFNIHSSINKNKRLNQRVDIWVWRSAATSDALWIIHSLTVNCWLIINWLWQSWLLSITSHRVHVSHLNCFNDRLTQFFYKSILWNIIKITFRMNIYFIRYILDIFLSSWILSIKSLV